jgi:hypothetical protein
MRKPVDSCLPGEPRWFVWPAVGRKHGLRPPDPEAREPRSGRAFPPGDSPGRAVSSGLNRA